MKLIGSNIKESSIPLTVPFYGKGELDAVNKYLKSKGYITEYELTEKFERNLAAFLKVPYVSVVTSGTVALYIALLASGLPKNSAIAVPDLTMIATYNAVLAAGMRPVLVDVDKSGCLDLSKISEKIDGLIYVELNGRSDNMDEVDAYCKKNKIVFIEDACQALGSKYINKYLGTFARFGCFSLGFHKIITTGQGGFIVSHNKKDHEVIEKLKDFGRERGGDDIHNSFGFNFKFTDLQASFGLAQIANLSWRIKKKRQLYEWYWGKKAESGYVPWLIDYQTSNLEKDFQKLKRLGIGARKMYPPLNTQKFIDFKGKFPMSQKISDHTLWLPSSLSLTRKEVNTIRENFK